MLLFSALLLTGCSLQGSPLLMALEKTSEPSATLNLSDMYPDAEHIHISCTNNSKVLAEALGYDPLRFSHLRDDHKNWLIITNKDGSYDVETYNKFTIRFCEISDTYTIREVTEETLTFEKYNAVWLLTPAIGAA